MMSEKRNAVADLAVCEATEKEFERQKNLGGWIDMCLPKDLADFINTAREALPYWIKRAQEAEAEINRYQKIVGDVSRRWRQAHNSPLHERTCDECGLNKAARLPKKKRVKST
jgi:hypothetical protein